MERRSALKWLAAGLASVFAGRLPAEEPSGVLYDVAVDTALGVPRWIGFDLPPYHPMCRCVIVRRRPLAPGEQELLDASTDMWRAALGVGHR